MSQPLPQPLIDLRQKAQKAHMDDKPDAARVLYEKYLAAVPRDPTMWTNLGAMLRAQKLYDMALFAQRRAYAQTPDNEIIRNNLANILADTGHVEEALKLRRSLLVEKPDDPNIKAMTGKALRTLGHTEEAIDLLLTAQIAHPDYAEITIQLALSQLAHGDYANGFVSFDKRWETDELTPRNISKPKWDGGPLDGKSIMVLPEQGFGDGIAMSRFLPVLRKFNPARVMLATERPLLRLFEGIEGADWIGSKLDEGDSFDVWTNIMDLPTLHFASAKAIPAPARLNVPEAAIERAKSLLAPYGKTFNVGVVWTGSLTYRGNAARSFSHTEFHRLIDIPNVQLFSLYKGPKLEEYRADASAHFILDAGGSEKDFADCAAMMQKLDLVITSDTATAHLAGSLGVPVWMVLHWDAFWMWQLEHETSPWYPSMMLYRQKVAREWAPPFEQVKRDLTVLAKQERA